MFSEETRINIENSIQAELKLAEKNFGKKYHSYHEGYAVLKEEIEETKDNLRHIEKNLCEMWEMVKDDDNSILLLMRELNGYATLLAMESVQVAAVAEKILRGIN